MLKKILSDLTGAKKILYWLLPAALLIIASGILSIRLDVSIHYFYQDPTKLAGVHPFFGIISNIGAILWSFSVAMCFFTCANLRTNRTGHDLTWMIFWGGSICGVGLLDDLFMLHDYIYPVYLGIAETTTFVVYAVLILIYLIKFAPRMLNTKYPYILVSILFFALSLLIDTLTSSFRFWSCLLEDGFKLLGIVSLLGYNFSICRQSLQPPPHAPKTSD